MSTINRVLARLERERRKRGFSAEALCFPPQLGYVRSRSKRVLADCSRRAGKSEGTAIRKLEMALEPPYAPQLYVTLTRLNAKQIIWPVLLRLNNDYSLGGIPNHSELILRMPNGADIHLAGANNDREIEKIRGKKFKGATIDEPQSMPDRILKPLVNDAIGPTLLDYDGYLAMTGTPGPLLAGYFYEAAHSGRWERHRWTLKDNPHLPRLSGKPIDQLLAEIRTEHGWTEEDATYKREYLGQWVNDFAALVFAYDAVRNGAGTPGSSGRRCVFGVDLGHDDADAIAVLAWWADSPSLHLVEEYVAPKRGITELAEAIEHLRAKYDPEKIVMDFGGLGKKIAIEVQRRWSLPVEAAEKTRKFEHIELLNDALRTGRFFADPSSRFAQDCMLVQWDMDARAKGVLKISDGFHSDICDAVLYAYRAAAHYLYEPEKKAKPTPDERADEWERREMEAIERRKTLDWVDADAERLGFE